MLKKPGGPKIMEKRDDKPIHLSLSLPRSQHAELEALRQARGKKTVQELIQDAVAQYLLVRRTAMVPLTPRQRAVLQLVAQGKKSREIAGQLKISVKTVEMHRTQLMDVLGVHNIAGLVRYAIRMGLIAP